MSKAIYICFKDPSMRNDLIDDLKLIARRIVPDNITPNPPRIVEKSGILYGITNPSDLVEEKNGGVLLGTLFEDEQDWWEPGKSQPDGTYVIFRSDSRKVEVLTDVVGSRSVWYYFDDKLFVAATSQRAIAMVLKSFDLNKNVIPWLLSSGGLGYGNSWDTRVNLVPADSAVRLDRLSWSVSTHRNAVKFTPSPEGDDVHEQGLRNAFRETFERLKLDFSKWVLPLSGGYDSRSILSLMHHHGGVKKLKAVTWGLKSAKDQKGNDAYVATQVAKHFNIQHQYFPTDGDAERLESILERFIVCGEGRIDHLSGYMDGFRIWKTLFENGVKGVIRGDEGFGYPPVDSPVHVRKLLGVPLCDDYLNLREYQKFGIPKQEMPEQLRQRDGESLSTWRDRLYHEYRIPIVLAALTDLKLPYVELINPLLARKLIYQVRLLPDHLRTDKVLFKKIADSYSPKIPYATSSATESVSNILRSEKMVEIIKDELSRHGHAVFSPEFIDLILKNIKVAKNGESKNVSLRSLLGPLFKRIAPRWLHLKFVRKIQKSPTIGYNVVAFRAYLATRMNRLLLEDARCTLQEDQSSDKVDCEPALLA